MKEEEQLKRLVKENVFQKIRKGVNKAWDTTKDIKKQAPDVIKRETEETKQAMEILMRILKRQKVTKQERVFLKRQTGDVGKAQTLVGVSMDIARAKTIDLGTASKLVAKAYGGNIGALKKLFPQISAATVKSKDFAAAMREISGETKGAAAAAANTFAGQMERIKLAFGEASESLGYKLIPVSYTHLTLPTNREV